MVRTRTRFPKEGDFIIGRVKEIQRQYVYVDLIDFEGLDSEETATGMIHVSEISSSWIKNIRNFVRLNQIIVCRVLRVDPVKGHIDLSIRRVNSAQRKNRQKEHKYATKYENLLQFLSEEKKISMDEAYDLIGWPLLEMYGDEYQDTVEELKEHGDELLAELKNVPEDIRQAFIQIVDDNVKISTVSIIGKLKILLPSSNGIEVIKDALMTAKNLIPNPRETRKISISYLGAPFYRLEIITKDYMDAENILSDACEIIEEKIKANNGTFEFIRD